MAAVAPSPTSGRGDGDPAADRPLSALPSPGARILAFVSILLGGFAGGLIGYTLVKLQCHGECAAERGVGAFSGAVLAAIGMSIVAVLVLRAIGEWRQIEARERGAIGPGNTR